MATRRKFGIHDADKQLIQPENIATPSTSAALTDNNREESTVSNLLKKIEEPVKNSAFETKFVKRKKLVFSKDNDYPMEALEKLADEILELGLIHNLEVYYDEENDVYIVNSGERRTRAIDLLIKRFENYPEEKKNNLEYKLYHKHIEPFVSQGYPCKIVYPDDERDIYENLSDTDYETVSKLKKHIRLTVANESSREPDPARRRKKIESLNEDYNKLNAILDKAEKINVDKEIAKKLNISDRQVRKYKAVSKLIPELQAKFDEKQINLNDSANYAQLTENEQRQILMLIEDGGNKEELNALYDNLNRMKAEINSKEIQLKSIEQDKQAAQQQIETLQAQKLALEDALKAEAEKTAPEKELVTNLQAELENANKKLLDSEKQAEKIALIHEKEIASLQKKLTERDSRQVSAGDIAAIKSCNQLENGILNLTSELQQLEKYINDYKVSFHSENMKKPETYIAELKILLEDFTKKL